MYNKIYNPINKKWESIYNLSGYETLNKYISSQDGGAVSHKLYRNIVKSFKTHMKACDIPTGSLKTKFNLVCHNQNRMDLKSFLSFSKKPCSGHGVRYTQNPKDEIYAISKIFNQIKQKI